MGSECRVIGLSHCAHRIVFQVGEEAERKYAENYKVEAKEGGK